MYLQVGLCYISEQIGVLKVPSLNVLNVSQKSTRIEGKNVLAVVPLNYTYDYDTFSIALASVKSESYQQLIKICSQGKHCNNLYVYMHVYTYNRSVSSPRRLGSFEVRLFRLELLDSA